MVRGARGWSDGKARGPDEGLESVSVAEEQQADRSERKVSSRTIQRSPGRGDRPSGRSTSAGGANCRSRSTTGSSPCNVARQWQQTISSPDSTAESRHSTKPFGMSMNTGKRRFVLDSARKGNSNPAGPSNCGIFACPSRGPAVFAQTPAVGCRELRPRLTVAPGCGTGNAASIPGQFGSRRDCPGKGRGCCGPCRSRTAPGNRWWQGDGRG